jgi:hypothetical protein
MKPHGYVYCAPNFEGMFCETWFITSSDALLDYLVEEENWIPKFLVDARLL